MAILKIIQGSQRRELAFEPPMLLAELLQRAGVEMAMPCGGRGSCGKCAVLLTGAASGESAAEQRFGVRLACQAHVLGDAEVTVPVWQGAAQILRGSGRSISPAGTLQGRYGAAVDVGTTTLALQLYDLGSGRCVGSAAMMNPQTTVAADVIGRIDAAMHGRGTLLQGQITGALGTLMTSACAHAGVEGQKVDRLVVTGNTTMQYLLTGRDPACLGHAPFQADWFFGQEEQVLGRMAYLPRCFHAFVGADTACAILACGMAERQETELLCDVGTNGELALWRHGRLYMTSAAAGPAFEGAGISCGCSSIPGAIDRVELVDGRLQCSTIGGGKARGVCGSGLLDAVAAMLDAGMVDETGSMDADCHLRDGVYLTRADIRAVQLAKAAIFAGIGCLLAAAGCRAEDVDRVHLAGGFGSHMNVASAVRIGMIPEAMALRVRPVGNAALDGAAMLLLSPEARRFTEGLAEKAQHVPLDGSAVFAEQYVEAMMFPEME